MRLDALRSIVPFLALVSGACGDAPTIPAADPDPAVLRTIEKVEGDGQSGQVGSPVRVAPVVRVRTLVGKGLPGVEVRFEVEAGGGSVLLGRSVTDSLGYAEVGAWVLGRHAGENRLRAAADGVPPVVFVATSLAGPATTLVKVSGDNQDGHVSSALDAAPVVCATDAHGNPVGVPITFRVVSGGGLVDGAVQWTDGTCRARPWQWTLGPSPGPNALEASSPGLPSATFTALAFDRCVGSDAYAIGSTVEGSTSPSGCRRWRGQFTDRYAVHVASATSVELALRSAAFVPHVSLFDAVGAPVASSGYSCPTPDCSMNAVRVLLPVGDYVVGVSGFTYDYNDNPRGGVAGPYSFSSTIAPDEVAGCADDPAVFIVAGVETTQQIEATDCDESYNHRQTRYPFYYDRIEIYLVAGQTYTIAMSSPDFDTFLELGLLNEWRVWSQRVAVSDDFGGSTDSRIEFTPTEAGLFRIHAATADPAATGSYTLMVQ